MMKKEIKTWSTPVTEENRQRIPCALCGSLSFKAHYDCAGFSFVRCQNCGLIQANPQAAPDDVARRYRDKHGEDYLEYELSNEEAFLKLQLLGLQDAGFDALEKEIFGRNVNSTGEILDIGCATGALLEQLRKKGWNCSGVELCTESAVYAREKRGLNVIDKTLEEAAFPDNHFDVILASHLIEHLNDPASFIRETYRILKDDGRIIITTPNADGLQAKIFGSRWRSAIFDHLYLFSVKTLSKLLIRHGYIIEQVQTWGGLAAGTVPKPLKKVADTAAKRFGFGDVVLIKAWKQT